MKTFTDDTVVSLASFLSPHDMLSLALTCKRFGAKHGIDKKRLAAREESSTREVRQRTESISLMEIAARAVLHAKWTDEEKKALPRREDKSWISLYQEFLSVFRIPLQYDKLVGGGIKYASNTDKTRVCSNTSGEQIDSSTAICSNIMRAGKHSVSFQVNDNDPETNLGIICGIMRPTTIDITSLDSCHPTDNDLSRFSLKDYEILHSNNVDCCLFITYTGFGIIRRRWKRWTKSELMVMNVGKRLQARLQNNIQRIDWEGMGPTHDNSFKIGMVLDLDEGTLDVYKNDRHLGTMKSGLVGEYCWVVSLNSLGAQISVSIGR